ncbi:MAG: sodium-translocating pyrophosphatase [Elusimicrobia bacterium]|nr:sodium-translocating pyrophosphatase [Elusimicrobiota bacterium]
MLISVLAVSLLALLFAAVLAMDVLRRDTGTPEMRVVSDAIREGAQAFLRRQYLTIGILTFVVSLIIAGLYILVKHQVSTALTTAFAFLVGAFCSALSGYLGMSIAIRANIRTASAARRSQSEALMIALRGGAVSGVTIVALSLLGVGGLFWLLGGMQNPWEVPLKLVGFGFGASFVALFAQLGGGIYTKAADVGADLVGKVEAGIPEDDQRNPAVIADLVGDNVGDCAGRGADLFESTAAENIGAMILGVALYPYFGIRGVMFPLVARAFGLLASMVGVMVVRGQRSVDGEERDPMTALNQGFYVTSLLAAMGLYVATRWLLGNNLWLFAAGLIGLITSWLFLYITLYYTDHRFRPVLSIVKASQTGPATNIITGLAVALECTALPVIVISLALVGSYACGVHGLAQFLGISSLSAGLYGTAVATMGMLSVCAYILAMDTFGPITDNASGIIEMSGQSEEVHRKAARLDAVGNTTKALTKGYAIGSAALAAFLLFAAYLDEVRHLTGVSHHVVNLARVEVFTGGMLGVMLVFLFSSLAIRAVGKAAGYVIQEVRLQFRETPDILTGQAKPNYARCVDIVTKGALKEMILPGLLVVAMPIAVGLIFRGLGTGVESVAALLMVGTIGGILLATFMNNGGGAWDNAKKFVEAGSYGGKGSDTHKATVVGDTVGDPLKDTAGPSLHVLIKLLATITLVLAPLFV